MSKHRFRTMAVASMMLVSAAFFLAPVTANAGGGDNCQAGTFVNSAAVSLMRAAKSGSAGALTAAVASFSDINAIALNALGPYRSKLSKARQGEYLQRAKTYIGKFLAENAKRFKGSGITISSCRMAGGTLLVESRLEGGGRILWKVVEQGSYRVQDVNVQQVWLVQQLRTNFVYKIRQNDENVDKFVDQLG
jgi:ABC-type transporter MlaC component